MHTHVVSCLSMLTLSTVCAGIHTELNSAACTHTTAPLLWENFSVLSGEAPLDSPPHYPAVSESRWRWCQRA